MRHIIIDGRRVAFDSIPEGKVVKRVGDTLIGVDASGASWGGVSGNLADQTDLKSALDAKQASGSYASSSHGHAIADTTGLQSALDGKSGSGHNHDAAYSAIGHTHPGGAEAFPVGSVFLSVTSTNPGTLLGYGTWSQIAGGRMLVGQSSGDVDFDTAEEIGGSKTSSSVVNHSHGVTISDPGHAHVENSNNATTGSLRGWGAADTSTNTSTATGYSTGSSTTGITASTGDPAGGVSSFSILNPYFVVYVWKRTA